jgi:transcription-repair coupling factor (superfamily II helicase)
VPDLEVPGAGEALSVEIDLPLAAMLPAGYISDRALRLRLYRRLAMLRSEGELPELRRELEDRFGPPPPEVDNLLFLLRAKMLAAEAQVEGISVENGQILVHAPGAEQRYRVTDVPGHVRRSKRGLWITRAQDWPERLEELLRALGRVAAGR